MPETAILNADLSWRADLDDALGPDYGWERLRQPELATTRPAFGRPWDRTVQCSGHTTTFSWLKRSRACADYLKRWAEQHRKGFFTIIDHDGGGRHYVGRFTGTFAVTQAANDTYNMQGWTFEEIPGCPMLAYPSDWQSWAVFEHPVDDYGDANTATYSATGTWAQPAAALDHRGILRAPQQLMLTGASAGDWAQHEYVGYGFRLYLVKGPGQGTVQIWLDGTLVQDNLSLATASYLGPQIVYSNANVALGAHRVKVVTLQSGTAEGGAATFAGWTWDKVEVMR